MSWELINCCLCLPLRVGLLSYGYSALVINYLIVLHKLCEMNDYLEGPSAIDSNKFIVLSLTFAILIIHFIFHIVLVAGLHKTLTCLRNYLRFQAGCAGPGHRSVYKDWIALIIVQNICLDKRRTSCGLLEVFYGFQVILVIFEVVIASLYFPLQLYKNYGTLKYYTWIPVVTLVCLFICVLLQVYLITAVRSFITKLDDGKAETYQPASHLNTLDDTGCTLQFYNKAKEYCDECDP